MREGWLGEEHPLAKRDVEAKGGFRGHPSRRALHVAATPSRPWRRGFSPQRKERLPLAGSGGPGACLATGKGLAGPGPPRGPLMGRAPPRRAAGGLTWGAAPMGRRREPGGRRGPSGRRAVKEASQEPGAGAALCVSKLREPPPRPRSP